MTTMKLVKNLAVSESGFLFLPTTGETFTVNEIGREVLAALQTGKVETEIVSMLTERYDVEPNAVVHDVRDFLSQLGQHHLLTQE